MSSSSTTTVLLLESGPPGSEVRRTREFKRVRDGLRQTIRGRSYTVEHEYAVVAVDLIDLGTRLKPAIVHFSGHANEAGELVFNQRDGSVCPADPESISQVFGLLSRSVRCVVLNTCYSELQARRIARHIDVVIANHGRIHDEAAIEFAVGFYCALGNGESFESAYELGREQIRLALLPDRDVPRLITRRGVDPARMYLPDPRQDTVPLVPSIPVPVAPHSTPPRKRRPLRTLLGLALLGVGLSVLYGELLPPQERPVAKPIDDTKACDQGDAGACAKLASGFAHDGAMREANFYFDRACQHGDETSCWSLVPSAEQVCGHVLELLARAPTRDVGSREGLSRTTQEVCVADLVEHAHEHGRIVYERYAACVVASRDADSLARCRGLYRRGASGRERSDP